MSNPNEGDGKYVVIENGKRISGLHKSQEEALAEAEAKKKLTESDGSKSAVEVKRNLFG